MTDFFHEPQPPADAAPKRETPPGDEAPATERQRTRRVFLYAVVFFATAFLLILWSFLMANRSSQSVLSELKESASELQSSLEETGDIANLVSTLEEKLAETQERADLLEKSVLALDWMREIERAYAEGDVATAKSLIASFAAHDLAQYLPEEPLQTSRDTAVPSAAETYRAICAELFPNGTP